MAAAAAYGALTSLTHIINDILTSPNSNQLISLGEKVNFLLDFLEHCPKNYSSDLEIEIREAAYAAEDVIETHISNQLLLDSQVYVNCVRQLIMSCFQNLRQLLVPAPERRSEISYESFDRLFMGERAYESQTFNRSLLQSDAPLNEKLVFAAQKLIGVCALTYNRIEYSEHHSMVINQGHEAYAFFLQVRSDADNENIFQQAEEDPDLIQRVMKDIHSIIATVEGAPKDDEVGDEYLFYHMLLYGDHLIWQMISAAWNVVCALRQQVLIPKRRYLQKLIRKFVSIMEKAVKIKDSCTSNLDDHPTTRDFLPAASPSRSDSRISRRSIVVGFEAESMEIMTQLLGDSSKVEIVSVVGMGGIGKTTLAKRVYDDICIVDRFDIRAWVTVSQEYSMRKVLLALLEFTKRLHREMYTESDERLAEYLYKSLKGRRYLIVMDDIWDVEVWDTVRRLFPEDSNSSRILVTTRLLDVAQCVNSCSIHQMRFLSKNESWNLLSYKVFAEKECPPELKELGEEIACNCGGLPLAIVVAGGLLSKLSRTVLCWRAVANNLISLVAKDDEKCLEILALSYSQLPYHLKPCFLYMGVFPEDFEIPVSKLVHLWVAEGILRPHTSKSLEVVAEEYLGDLIERSLISVGTWSRSGKVKTCNVHDLLRELCIRNAEKEKFFQVANLQSGVIQDSMSNQRKLSIHPDVWNIEYGYYSTNSTSSPVRSFIRTGRHLRYLVDIHLPFRLLRVLDVVIIYFSSFPSEIIELVNLRYLALTYNGSLPPSILNLRNLQTIVHHNGRALRHGILLPVEIWIMPKLRHLCFTAARFPEFLDAEYFANNFFLLENLRTLMVVRDFKFSKDIVKRIPNLEKLVISYAGDITTNWSSYHFENIVDLRQLDTLKFSVVNPRFDYMPHAENLTFPCLLKSLTLRGCRIPWKYMTTIGELPNLEVLKLRSNAFQGLEWDPVEEGFRKLKFLLIEETNLVYWRADSIHFPSLQHLIIRSCSRIEIPSSIGDIYTLQMIELFDCGPSAVNSAKQIQQEQQDMGNDYLEVRIGSRKKWKDVNKSQILR